VSEMTSFVPLSVTSNPRSVNQTTSLISFGVAFEYAFSFGHYWEVFQIS